MRVISLKKDVTGVFGMESSAPWQERLNLPYSEATDNIYWPVLRSLTLQFIYWRSVSEQYKLYIWMISNNRGYNFNKRFVIIRRPLSPACLVTLQPQSLFDAKHDFTSYTHSTFTVNITPTATDLYLCIFFQHLTFSYCFLNSIPFAPFTLCD